MRQRLPGSRGQSFLLKSVVAVAVLPKVSLVLPKVLLPLCPLRWPPAAVVCGRVSGEAPPWLLLLLLGLGGLGVLRSGFREAPRSQ